MSRIKLGWDFEMARKISNALIEIVLATLALLAAFIAGVLVGL